MYTHVIVILLAVVGLPSNFLLMYVVAATSERIAISEIFILHLSVTNVMQLTARIPVVLISNQGDVCYPMIVPCKMSLFILFCSRKACIWFTLKLDLYYLVRLKNKSGFLRSLFLNRQCVIFFLALNWVMWIAAGLPYPLLIPSDRPRQHSSKLNSTCVCSFLDSVTDTDSFLKTYDMIMGTAVQSMAIILLCLVDIKVIWILLRHQQAIFSETTTLRSHQREIHAIKVITSLVVVFVVCHLLNAFLRNFSGQVISDLKAVFETLYPAASPVILGFGDQRFKQKIMCMICWKDCKKAKVSEVITVS